MNRFFRLLSFLTLASGLGTAPLASAQQAPSPYHTSFKKDGLITVGLAGVNTVGLLLIRSKTGPTREEVLAFRKEDVNAFDRFSAGYYDENARTISDYIFAGSLLATPVFLGLNQDTRARAGQVAGLYVQTLAATGALFTMAAGNVYRQRPLSYSSEASITQRSRINATNSFFAGHTATTAAATFFAAKVYHDFHPDSRARPFVWAAAAAVPAAVGYYRLQAGKHFLSDNLLGYTVGAAAGILVPQFHKSKGDGSTSLVPIQGLTPGGASYGGLLWTKRL
jgi:membrane-associated phospholipid phosphatase